SLFLSLSVFAARRSFSQPIGMAFTSFLEQTFLAVLTCQWRLRLIPDVSWFLQLRPTFALPTLLSGDELDDPARKKSKKSKKNIPGRELVSLQAEFERCLELLPDTHVPPRLAEEEPKEPTEDSFRRLARTCQDMSDLLEKLDRLHEYLNKRFSSLS